MNTARARLVGLALAGCTVLAGSGCASDVPPTALGPGVVTPGGASAGPASSAPPDDSSATPTQSASPSPSSPSTARPTTAARSVPPAVRDDDAEIEAANQSGDGRTVRIQEAQLSRAGFVVVYAVDGNRLLGSAKIKASSDDDQLISVKLDRRLTSSARLLVALHADDGDGRFDVQQDPRVTGGDDDDDDGADDDDDGGENGADRITYRVR